MNKEEIMKWFNFRTGSSGNKYLYDNSYNEISDVVDRILTFYNSKFNELKEKVYTHELKTAELEAKVYAYEKIISNSNFKAILEDKEVEDD